MKRKHIPGCYCCGTNEPCPECCDPEEVIPTSLTPSIDDPELWTRVDRDYDEDCCCLKERWVYNQDEPIYECCNLMSVNTWQTQDVRTDALLKFPVNFSRIYCNTNPPPCDNSLCCVEDIVDVCTWIMTIDAEQRNYFAVWIYLDGLDVSWTRETVRCPDTNPPDPINPEPKCRYVLKIVVKGHYTWRVNSNFIGTTTVDNTFLHPCYILCEEILDCHVPIGTTTEEQCDHPDLACSADINIGDPFCQLNCGNTRGSGNCYEGQEFFCWERIKYFDEPPEEVTFTNNDIINENPFDPDVDCDEPKCVFDCLNGYYDHLEINPPVFNPPHWCNSPPTIQTSSTNYTFDYTVCQAISSNLIIVECGDFPFISVRDCSDCCTNPLSITVNLDQLVIPNWNDEENECRFRSTNPSGFCDTQGALFPDPIGIRSCIFPPGRTPGANDCVYITSVCPFPFGVIQKPITGYDPCEPSACYESFYCPENCFNGCRNKNFGCHFTKSLDTTLTINCQTFSNVSCVWPIPEMKITLEF